MAAGRWYRDAYKLVAAAATSWVLGLAFCAHAEDLSAYLNDYAMKDYVHNCAGCHRADGKGAEHLGIPNFREHIGVFTHLPQGREYLIRVPGASQSLLNDARLADVLNWIIATYDNPGAQRPFKAFTAAEVTAVRAQRFDDVAQARRALTQALHALGLEAAPYTYGASALQE